MHARNDHGQGFETSEYALDKSRKHSESSTSTGMMWIQYGLSCLHREQSELACNAVRGGITILDRAGAHLHERAASKVACFAKILAKQNRWAQAKHFAATVLELRQQAGKRSEGNDPTQTCEEIVRAAEGDLESDPESPMTVDFDEPLISIESDFTPSSSMCETTPERGLHVPSRQGSAAIGKGGNRTVPILRTHASVAMERQSSSRSVQAQSSVGPVRRTFGQRAVSEPPGMGGSNSLSVPSGHSRAGSCGLSSKETSRWHPY